MTLTERATVFEDLGRMLKAGLSYKKSLETLSQRRFSGTARRFVNSIRAGVGDSLGLAESLRGPAAADALPMEVSIIDAGERGGKLEDACGMIARHHHVAARLLSRLRYGFIYPILTLHMALGVMALVQHMEESALSILGHVFLNWAWMWVALAVIWFGVALLLRKGTEHAGVDKFLRRIPLVGSMREQAALSRFARVCNVGMLAGLRMSETLRLAAAATQVPRLQAAGNKAAENVEHGFTLADAMGATHAFPFEFVDRMVVAESTGDLDGAMDRQAVESAGAAERSIERLAFVLPKVFYALVACVAIYVIFEFYLGRLQAIQSFGN